MLSVDVLTVLVGIDILFGLWIEYKRPNGLTSMEFHFFMQDWLRSVKEEISEEVQEIKLDILENRITATKKVLEELEQLKEQLKDSQNDEI